MYPVSNAYITALKQPSVIRRLTGTIGSLSFDESNIIKGSLIIDNKCSNENSVDIGTVYAGQLSCTFTGIDLTGEWMGKIITVAEGLLVGEDTWEDVPLGKFKVIEAQRSEIGVTITARDAMSDLDKNMGKGVISTGTPWDFIALISQKTGVVFAQTEQEIKALPNGSRGYTLYAENDVETYHDLLYWVAQTVGCFATCNRDNEIELRAYGSTAVDDIGVNDRWTGAEFADYVSRYTGVSVTDVEEQKTHYVGADIDDGLTYNLGANPFMQNITVEPSLNEILTALGNINYTPFTVVRSGCPAYDLGDVVTFSGGLGMGATGCIMAYEYSFHNNYRIQGYGSNPALASAKSKQDKDISGLMSRINSEEFQYYTYLNAEELEIRETYKEIINIRFGSLKTTIVTFQCEIKLTAEQIVENDSYHDIVANVKYFYNDHELDYKPVETYMDGDHLLHLMYVIPIQGSAINTFKVKMNCVGGVISVGRANLNAYIAGQGLVLSTEWDGWIECEDNITELTLADSMEVAAFVDECEIKGITPITIEIEDNIEVVEITNEPIIVKYGDAMYINRNPIGELTWYDVLYRVVPAANIYDPSVSYVPYDICYTLNGDAHIEWRCTAETTGEFDESCWEVRTYNTWGEVYEYYGW